MNRAPYPPMSAMKHGGLSPPYLTLRSFAWVGGFRPLARDYERLGDTLAGLHLVACSILVLSPFAQLTIQIA